MLGFTGITIVMAHRQTEKAAFVVQGTTSDALPKVAGFYEQETKRLGWKEESNTSQENKLKILTYRKGERRLQVMLSAQDKGTTVNLSLANE